jgi:hypothetical protein
VYTSAAPRINRLQPEYLLINEAVSGTGLQEALIDWNPAEWDGVSNTYWHEHSANTGASNTKLRDLDTPADIANSNITGDDLTRSGSAITMPGSQKEIDTDVITA